MSPRDRLESWKEIAAHLNRSERTVRRWEDKEGLPIHRLHHDKRGSVYAYASELDAWRSSRRQLLEVDAPGATAAAPVSSRRARWVLVAAAALLMTTIGGLRLVKAPGPSRARTPNPEAVRVAARAQFGSNSGRTQIRTGIHYYQEAIRLDPGYAPAWAGLATAHIALTWFGEDPAAETMASATREAREALRLDASDASAWRVLAFATHYLDWDHQTAERHFRKAIELSPNDAVVLSWFGDFLADLRRFDEARTYYRRAQEASPRWLQPSTFAANVHQFTGNADQAIAEHQRVLDTEPSFGLGNHFLGRAYLAKGDYARAVEQLRKSNELLGRVPFSLGDLGYALAIGGERAAAETMLADLMQKRSHGYYPAFPIAQIHLGLGQTDAALEWLERAADERHLGFYFPSADPIYDAVRSHPRFRKLLERINVPGP